jgi:hypothetical protein
VDEATARAINARVDRSRATVRGRVRRQNQGVEGLIVRACGCKLRSKTLLGEAVTDRQGNYEITYSPGAIPRTAGTLPTSPWPWPSSATARTSRRM